MRKTWCVALALLSLLLLALLVGASQCPLPGTPTPEPIWRGECSVLPEIQGTLSAKEGYTVKVGDHFVKDQIIVAGYRDHIDQVIHEVPYAIPVTLTLVNTITLEYLEGHLGDDTYAKWGINLYRITSTVLVTDTVSAVRKAIDELSGGRVVFADPNYLTGRPTQAAGGSGDPDCVEGDPAGGSAPVGHKLFWNQWAFGEPGIRLFTSGESDRVAETGKGTQVVIFDTSPFKKQGEWAIPWVTPTLTLCVSHPGEVVPLNYEGNTLDFRDHGLFVAGLVHAVAPDSEIHLVRVLNAQNQGDLDTLLNAINLLIRKALEEAEEGDKKSLAGTVINLSLGVHPESENLIEPLKVQLLIARACGAVVVAAAGNDSSGAKEPEPMQYPAAYTSVIGVAGSNINGARACFSNRGDVAAPSGDNGPGCEPMVDYCGENPTLDCEYCLISVVTRNTSETGYAFWAGTSFATPLVSGQAALLLEKKGVVPGSMIGWITGEKHVMPATDDPDHYLGAGIVNLRKSLEYYP